MAAWLLADAWPAFSGFAALAGHLAASLLSEPERRRPRRAGLALYALFGVAMAAPLLVQADVFRPGGVLSMAVIAAGVLLVAVLLVAGPLAPRRSSRRSPLLFLEAVLLVPLGAWCLRGDTPPVWFGALLTARGGLALAESLVGRAPLPGTWRGLTGLASGVVLVVGVGLFWLAGA